MSETPSVDETMPATAGDEEQQVPEVEVKQEAPEATSEAPAKDDSSSTAMEVDSSQKEESAADDDEEEGEEDKPFRRNGASRKRFKWLLEQGYSRSAAAQISRTPFKPKEMREKFIADTGFFKEKINQLNEEDWESLSDATKRRLKWLMKNGYTETDALRLAKDPNDKAKRNLPGNGDPSRELLVRTVASADFPKTFLTKEQMDQFKSAILEQVVQQKDAELKPHFKNCVEANGYLRVECADENTCQWLKDTVAKLEVPEELSLKVDTEMELLKGDVYTGHFADSRKDSNETIFGFIESQNDGIVTSEWAVITRKDVGDEQKVELLFAVDEESADAIRKLNFELNYKFNTIRLRRKNLFVNPVAKGPKPTQGKKRTLKQASSSSFVPIWDSNLPKNRGGNNYNQSSGRARGSSYRGGGGFNNRGGGGRMANGNRPFNLVDSLYDQLWLISGGGGSNYNQWGGNNGFNRRNYRGRGGYRGFSPRSGF